MVTEANQNILNSNNLSFFKFLTKTVERAVIVTLWLTSEESVEHIIINETDQKDMEELVNIAFKQEILPKH